MNERLISRITAASFASLFSVGALSAPVVNLNVSGKITPPTCMVNGSNETDLLYSFGKISPTVVPQDSPYNELPSLSNNLTVICDAETFLTFKTNDSYPNEFDHNVTGANINYRSHVFNLVDSKDTTKNVGGITFRYRDITVDGVRRYLSHANDGYYDNGTWSPHDMIVKDATLGWTSEYQVSVELPALKLQSGKEFTAVIVSSDSENNGVSETFLHSKSALEKDGVDITNGLDYIGQAIITFNFGI